MTDTSENDEDLAKAVAWIGAGDVAVSNHTFILKHDLDPEYLSLFFSSEGFQRQKRRYIYGTKVRTISQRSLEKIKVPVPPKPKQVEIRKKLMTMYSLVNDISSGLPAEIEARRKQYEYYRDKLLTFKEKAS